MIRGTWNWSLVRSGAFRSTSSRSRLSLQIIPENILQRLSMRGRLNALQIELTDLPYVADDILKLGLVGADFLVAQVQPGKVGHIGNVNLVRRRTGLGFII